MDMGLRRTALIQKVDFNENTLEEEEINKMDFSSSKKN